MMARFMAFPLCSYVLDTMERLNWFTSLFLDHEVLNSAAKPAITTAQNPSSSSITISRQPPHPQLVPEAFHHIAAVHLPVQPCRGSREAKSMMVL